MLTAHELWGLLDDRRKSELLMVASRDRTFESYNREQLKKIAEELHENWINSFPVPSDELVKLAQTSKAKATIAYRDEHGCDLRAAKEVIEEALRVA